MSPRRKAPDSNRPAYVLGCQEESPSCCSWPRKPDKPVPDAGNSSARLELLKIIPYEKLIELSQETRGGEERNILGSSQLYQRVSDVLDKDKIKATPPLFYYSLKPEGPSLNASLQGRGIQCQWETPKYNRRSNYRQIPAPCLVCFV